MYYNTVNYAYCKIARDLDLVGVKQNSRNGITKEIHPYMFSVFSFENYFLTVKGRVINFPMALAEIIWIMAGSDEYWITEYNKQLKDYADSYSDSYKFNSAYGKRMRFTFGVDQLEDAIAFLTKDNGSRQAGIVYRYPTTEAANLKTLDRACNISSLFLIRNGKLDITQTVRSHDFIWGIPYNFIQFGYITQYIAKQLEIPVGAYHELDNSLHVYEKHWNELDKISPNIELSLDMSVPDIGNHKFDWYSQLVDSESLIRNEFLKEDSIEPSIKNIEDWTKESPFWHDALLVLYSYHIRRDVIASLAVLDRVNSDLFKLLALRYYLHYWKHYWGNQDVVASTMYNYFTKWEYNWEETKQWLI